MMTDLHVAVCGLVAGPVAALAIWLGSPSPAEEERAQARAESAYAVWHAQWADTRETLGKN